MMRTFSRENSTTASTVTGEELLNDWKTLDKDFAKLETEHAEYLDLLKNLHKKEQECIQRISARRRDLTNFKEKFKKVSLDHVPIDIANQVRDLAVELADKKTKLEDMNEQLPHQNNGLYLNIILGYINVSLTNKTDKFRYKDEYEKFKITVTLICMVFATLALCFHFRVLDAAFHFLLVWYYCTLTIRESILRCNGSRIKGWWVAHHYFSAVLCGITLTWPDGVCYQSFRKQFLLFSLYLTVVQLIQCQYQRGCLYRLRSLGESHSMAITIEGFHMWMFRGLTFVLPFLILGYVAQLYNAYTLFKIWGTGNCSQQWQVLATAILFLLIAIGNSATLGQVFFRKFRESKKMGHRQRLKTKYSVDIREEDEKVALINLVDKAESTKMKVT